MVKRDTVEAIAANDHIELVRHFVKLREINEAIKKSRKALDELEEHLSREDVPDAFKKARIKTTTIEDVGRVSIARQWYCSILDGKKPEAFQWLREGGNGAIITETIPWQTLAAFAQAEVTTHGREMPDDKFKTTIKPYTSITKV
jgi:hypothetical protein